MRIIRVRHEKVEKKMLNTLKECPYYLISRVSLLVTAALKKELASSGVEQVKPVTGRPIPLQASSCEPASKPSWKCLKADPPGVLMCEYRQ
jgi:hypothetical protein